MKERHPDRFRRQLFIVSCVILALTALACTLLGTNSRSSPDRVAIRKRLATLTPTPLPTPAPPLTTPAAQTDPTTPIPFTPTAIPAVSTAAPIPQVDNSPTLTALADLNIRAGPGLDYPTIGQLAPGQSVPVTGKNQEGTWWQIIYPPDSSSLAWASADAQYSTVAHAENVPVISLPAPLAEVPTTIINPTFTPTPTATAAPGGWAFAGVRLQPDPEMDGLILYGNAVNQTGAAQEVSAITGVFFDGQGQITADAGQTYAYWPVYVVPPGGSMPFELMVDGINSAAGYDLSVEAETSSELPRQDFEFAQVNQWTEDETYCIGGVVQNAGGPLDNYWVVAAVLYDNQNNLVNFSDDGALDPQASNGNSPFEICVDVANQPVARHELLAWGH